MDIDEEYKVLVLLYIFCNVRDHVCNLKYIVQKQKLLLIFYLLKVRFLPPLKEKGQFQILAFFCFFS